MVRHASVFGYGLKGHLVNPVEIQAGFCYTEKV